MTLTVSLGTQYVTVPDLTNYVQSDAEQQLKALGVSVLVTQAVDTSVASGAVIRTTLPPVRRWRQLYGHPLYQPSAGVYHHQVPSLTGMSVMMPAPCWCRTIWGLAARVKNTATSPQVRCSARTLRQVLPQN